MIGSIHAGNLWYLSIACDAIIGWLDNSASSSTPFPWSGQECSTIHAPLTQSSTASPEFLRVNPNGQIPTIDADGLVLWESIAINLCLARKHSGSISAQSVQEEGLIEVWSFWAVNEAEPHAIKIVYVHDAGQHDTLSGQETLALASSMLKRPFHILDQHLSDQNYLVGNRFTVADLMSLKYCAMPL